MGRIILRDNQTSGSVPQASELELAELVINTTDGFLYSKNAAGTVLRLNNQTVSASYAASSSFASNVGSHTHPASNITGGTFGSEINYTFLGATPPGEAALTLGIDGRAGHIALNFRAASGYSLHTYAFQGSVARWMLQYADSGGDFRLTRFDDSGSTVSPPALRIRRSDGSSVFGGAVFPSSPLVYALGTSTARWSKLWSVDADISGSLISLNAQLTGSFTGSFTGSVTHAITASNATFATSTKSALTASYITGSLIGTQLEDTIRNITIYPAGYVENQPINFRFDQDVVRFANRHPGITVSSSFSASVVDEVLSELAGFVDLSGTIDPHTIEISGLTENNSANTHWWPYVMMHARTAVDVNVKMEIWTAGAGAWEEVFSSSIANQPMIIYTGSVTAGELQKARWTFSGYGGNNVYVRHVGVLGRNSDAYQWTVKRGGDTMYGDLVLYNTSSVKANRLELGNVNGGELIKLGPGSASRQDSTIGHSYIGFYNRTEAVDSRSAYIGTPASGNHNLIVMNLDNYGLFFGTFGTSRWQVTSQGMFLPVASNTYDIGNSSTTVKDIYLSSTGRLFGTASDATQAVSASYVSYDNVAGKPTLVSSSAQINSGSFTGSFTGSATQAVSASYALTASFVNNSYAYINFNMQQSASLLFTGYRTMARIPNNAYLEAISMATDSTGSVELDIRRTAWSVFRADDNTGASITGSTKLSMSLATKYDDSTLTAWDRNWTADDVVSVHIKAISGSADFDNLAVQMKVRRV